MQYVIEFNQFEQLQFSSQYFNLEMLFITETAIQNQSQFLDITLH